MMKPNRNPDAKYLTVRQMMEQTNLSRNLLVRLAKEADAYLSFGKAVRIDSGRFFEYVRSEYRG